jgi:hypothetical protein
MAPRRKTRRAVSSRAPFYDPDSPDAVMARLLAATDATALKAQAILEHVEKTNGRVTRLEMWKEVMTARITVVSSAAAIAGSIIGYIIQLIFK